MTHTSEPTIVASHNKSVVAIVITLIIGLAIGAFVLSFDALHALAIASAIEPNLAWIWPIIIDGFIVTATIAIFSLRGRGRTWYPWASLILFACVSVFGNSIHAVNNQDVLGVSVWIASSVSAAPAIALLLASHFLVIMISAPRKVRIDDIEVHSTQHPEQVLGTTILNASFEEPRIVVTPAAAPEETFIAPVMQPYTPPVVPAPIRKAVIPEPVKTNISAPSSIIPSEQSKIPEVKSPSAVEPLPAAVVEKPTATVSEPITKVAPVQSVSTVTELKKTSEVTTVPVVSNSVANNDKIIAEPVSNQPTTPETPSVKETPKKPNVVSDEEIINYLKTHDKNTPASKLSEVFGLSERTIHRRIRKLKDKFGESLENI